MEPALGERGVWGWAVWPAALLELAMVRVGPWVAVAPVLKLGAGLGLCAKGAPR